jgi:hypothetical protein
MGTWRAYGCLTGRLPGRLPTLGIPKYLLVHTRLTGHGSWMPDNCVSSSPGWLTLPCAWGPTCLAPCHRPLSLSLSFSPCTHPTPCTAPRLPFLRLHDFTLPVRHVGLLSHRNATRARLLRSQASGSTRLPLACFSPTIRDLASKRPPVFLEALLTLHPLRRAPDAAFCAISFPSPNTTRPLAPQLPLCNVSFVPSVSCVHPCLISSSD